MQLSEQLIKLTKTAGISGNEQAISQCLKEFYRPYCDEIVYDNLGSIYAVKRTKKTQAPRVLINTHMDELGFIVKKINDNGTLWALALGTVQAKALLGQKIVLTTRNKQQYPGVILGQNQTNDALTKNQEVLLDVGFANQQAAQASGVLLGDMVTFATPLFSSANQEYLYAPNWNGRLSVSQTVDFLRAIADLEFDFDLYVGCTVQEHVGIRGAQTATNLVAPDLTVALDTQQAFDYQTDAKDQQGVLGQGLLLTYYDPSVLPNRLLLNTFKEICQKQAITYQYYYSMTGSDAGWINKLRTGCPTLLLGQAVRNLDAGLQVAAISDYQALHQGLLAFVKQLTVADLLAFKQENR